MVGSRDSLEILSVNLDAARRCLRLAGPGHHHAGDLRIWAVRNMFQLDIITSPGYAEGIGSYKKLLPLESNGWLMR
jgi:hypothetical protein